MQRKQIEIFISVVARQEVTFSQADINLSKSINRNMRRVLNE